MIFRVALLAALISASTVWAAESTDEPAAMGEPASVLKIASDVCGACHGGDGNSSSPSYPSLAGQYPEYLVKQLEEFKSGLRKNALMAPNAAKLSSEEIAGLAAYYAAQQPKPRMAKDAALAADGQKMYKGGNPGSGVPACAACHGPSGTGIPVQFPRLAGQQAKYVLTQLQNFRSGDRSNDGGKMMQVIARKLTDQEMRAVAEFISGLR